MAPVGSSICHVEALHRNLLCNVVFVAKVVLAVEVILDDNSREADR